MPLEDLSRQRASLLGELQYLGEDAFALASKEYATFLDDATRPYVMRRRAGVVRDLLANARMLVDLVVAVSGGGDGGGGGAGLLPSCSQELTSMVARVASAGQLASGTVTDSAHVRREAGRGRGSTRGHGCRAGYEEEDEPGKERHGAAGSPGAGVVTEERRSKRRPGARNGKGEAGGGARGKAKGGYTARVVKL